jgi:hypothetical protein
MTRVGRSAPCQGGGWFQHPPGASPECLLRACAVVLHDLLGLAELLDDEVRLSIVDDPLDLFSLVSRDDDEAVVFRVDAVVLGSRQSDDAGTCRSNRKLGWAEIRADIRGPFTDETTKVSLLLVFPNRGGRTRTCNPRFWRPVLCQLSYAPSGSEDGL